MRGGGKKLWGREGCGVGVPDEVTEDGKRGKGKRSEWSGVERKERKG